MASQTISEVDTNFVEGYHSHKEVYELLHICWAQTLSPPNKKQIRKENDRLIVLTQLRLLVVKQKTFGSKRGAEREFLLSELTSIQIRVDSYFEATLIFDKEEVTIKMDLLENFEGLTKGLFKTMQTFKQVIPFYREPQIDCPDELWGQAKDFKLLNNTENIMFCYGLHCALAPLSQQKIILRNLAVKSEDRIFRPFKIIQGAKERKNDINVIINSAQTVDCFDTVEVAGQTIRQDTLREIGKLVLVNKSILNVDFPCCRLTKDVFSYFTKPFKSVSYKRPPLKRLNLTRNTLANLGDSFAGLENVGVEYLMLADCKLSKKSISNSLLNCLLTDSWLAEGGLRILNLNLNDLGKKGSKALVPFLEKTCALEELGLSETKAEMTVILQTIEKNTFLSRDKLRVLNISKNKMTPLGSAALADVLKDSSSISRVVMKGVGMEEISFEQIIKKIAKNDTGAQIDIDVSNNKLNTYAGEVFGSVECMGCALVSLFMADCNLGECKDFENIMRCLSTATNLRFLNLDFNFKANKKKLHLPKMQALAACVEKLSHIEFLSLEGNKPNHRLALQNTELVPIVNSLLSSKSLRRFNIRGNRLLDEGSKALAESLRVNTTLNILEFEDNKLSFDNFQTIVQSIGDSSGLQGFIPRETLDRLYHEKKKYRKTVDEWKKRLTKIFESNKQMEEEKKDVEINSRFSTGYDDYPENSENSVILTNTRADISGRSISFVEDAIRVEEQSNAVDDYEVKNAFVSVAEPGMLDVPTPYLEASSLSASDDLSVGEIGEVKFSEGSSPAKDELKTSVQYSGNLSINQRYTPEYSSHLLPGLHCSHKSDFLKDLQELKAPVSSAESSAEDREGEAESMPQNTSNSSGIKLLLRSASGTPSVINLPDEHSKTKIPTLFNAYSAPISLTSLKESSPAAPPPPDQIPCTPKFIKSLVKHKKPRSVRTNRSDERKKDQATESPSSLKTITKISPHAVSGPPPVPSKAFRKLQPRPLSNSANIEVSPNKMRTKRKKLALVSKFENMPIMGLQKAHSARVHKVGKLSSDLKALPIPVSSNRASGFSKVHVGVSESKSSDCDEKKEDVSQIIVARARIGGTGRRRKRRTRKAKLA